VPFKKVKGAVVVSLMYTCAL